MEGVGEVQVVVVEMVMVCLVVVAFLLYSRMVCSGDGGTHGSVQCKRRESVRCVTVRLGSG